MASAIQHGKSKILITPTQNHENISNISYKILQKGIIFSLLQK